MDSEDGKEPYPENITETTQGHPEEPYMDSNLIIDFSDDETLERAREALQNADQADEKEYLNALITVIEYHRNTDFNETDLL